MVSRLLEHLIQTLYLLWVLSYAYDFDNNTGIMPREDAMEVYTTVMLTGMLFSLLSTPLLGYLADKIPPHF